MLRKIYGVGGKSALAEAHLWVCEECAARWRQLLSRRAEVVSEAQEAGVSEERLRNQRAAVWARIDGRPRGWLLRWAPAGAAAGVIALGLLLLQPGAMQHKVRTPASPETRISDEQLFDDVARLSSPEAPQGAAPIRGLFEQRQDTEEEVAF